MARRSDLSERPGPQGPGIPGGNLPGGGGYVPPVVQGASNPPATTPNAPSPPPQPKPPQPAPAQLSLPPGAPAPPQEPPRGEIAAPGQRPGSPEAIQSLLARSGVRVGAFDPRQRGRDDQARSIARLLGSQGVTGFNPPAISAAWTPFPPNSIQFPGNEIEQSILKTLKG